MASRTMGQQQLALVCLTLVVLRDVVRTVRGVVCVVRVVARSLLVRESLAGRGCRSLAPARVWSRVPLLPSFRVLSVRALSLRPPVPPALSALGAF